MRVCACVCVCMLEVGGEGAVRWTRENVRSWGLVGDLCTGRDGRMSAVGRSMNVGLESLPGHRCTWMCVGQPLLSTMHSQPCLVACARTDCA